MGRSPLAMYAFAAIFGLGLGGEYLIIPLMAAELFGVKVLGRLLGVVLTADGVAEAVAPMGIGYLHDVTGSYHTGFVVLIGVALAGAVAILALPSRLRARPDRSLKSAVNLNRSKVRRAFSSLHRTRRRTAARACRESGASRWRT